MTTIEKSLDSLNLFCFAFFFFPITNQSLIDRFCVKKIYTSFLGRLTKLVFNSKTFIEYQVLTVGQ